MDSKLFITWLACTAGAIFCGLMITCSSSDAKKASYVVDFTFRSGIGETVVCHELREIRACGAYLVDCSDGRKHFCVTNVAEESAD